MAIKKKEKKKTIERSSLKRIQKYQMRLHWERAIICRMRWMVFNESSKRGGESTKCEHNTVQQHRISRPVGTWGGPNIVKNAITNRTRSDAADSVWTTNTHSRLQPNIPTRENQRGGGGPQFSFPLAVCLPFRIHFPPLSGRARAWRQGLTASHLRHPI